MSSWWWHSQPGEGATPNEFGDMFGPLPKRRTKLHPCLLTWGIQNPPLWNGSTRFFDNFSGKTGLSLSPNKNLHFTSSHWLILCSSLIYVCLLDVYHNLIRWRQFYSYVSLVSSVRHNQGIKDCSISHISTVRVVVHFARHVQQCFFIIQYIP